MKEETTDRFDAMTKSMNEVQAPTMFMPLSTYEALTGKKVELPQDPKKTIKYDDYTGWVLYLEARRSERLEEMEPEAGDTKEDCAIDAVIEDLLEFCGCGSPDHAVKFLYRYLDLCDRFQAVTWKETFSLFHNDYGLFNLVSYLCADKDLTDHGGSVAGSWIAPKGSAVLAFCNKYLSTLLNEPDEEDPEEGNEQ